MSLALDRIAAAPRRRRLIGLAAGVGLITALAWYRPPPSSMVTSTCGSARPPSVRTADEGVRETQLASALAQIRQLDASTYEVPRELVVNPDMIGLLRKVVRIVPTIFEGKPSGFRIYLVGDYRRRGLLGLRTGDVISTINGVPATERERTCGAYRMFTGDSIELGILRDGQPLTRTLWPR